MDFSFQFLSPLRSQNIPTADVPDGSRQKTTKQKKSQLSKTKEADSTSSSKTMTLKQHSTARPAVSSASRLSLKKQSQSAPQTPEFINSDQDSDSGVVSETAAEKNTIKCSPRGKTPRKMDNEDIVPNSNLESDESSVDGDIHNLAAGLTGLASSSENSEYSVLYENTSLLSQITPGQRKRKRPENRQMEKDMSEDEEATPSMKRRKQSSAPLTSTQVSQSQHAVNNEPQVIPESEFSDIESEMSQSILSGSSPWQKEVSRKKTTPVEIVQTATPRLSYHDVSPEKSPGRVEVAHPPARQLRYRLKEGYKEVEFEVNQETVCVEDVKGKELWLLRVSPQFDVNQLNGKEISMHGTTRIKTAEQENSRLTYQYQIHASKDKDLERSDMCVVLPSRRDGKLHYGGTLTGQMYLSQSVEIPECPLPQAETYQSRQLPAGLKMRHVPFGSVTNASQKSSRHKRKSTRQPASADLVATPTTTVEELDGQSLETKKKKKKKHKHSKDVDRVQDTESDETQLKEKKKKHKKHKKHRE